MNEKQLCVESPYYIWFFLWSPAKPSQKSITRPTLSHYFHYSFLWSFLFPYFIQHSTVCVADSKSTDEGIDDGDEKDDDENGVVYDICITLMLLIIDIETSQNKKKNSNNNL